MFLGEVGKTAAVQLPDTEFRVKAFAQIAGKLEFATEFERLRRSRHLSRDSYRSLSPSLFSWILSIP